MKAIVIPLRFIDFPGGGSNHRRPIIEVVVRQHGEGAAVLPGEPRCSALVDTGATGIRLGTRLVSELSLPVTGTETTWRSGETKPTDLVAARVLIPRATTSDGHFPVDNLDGCGFDVILGMDLLRHFNLQLYGPKSRGSLTWTGA